MNAERPETDDSINPTSAAPDVDDTGTDWSNTGDPPGDGSTESGWSGGNRWTGGGAQQGAQAWLTQLQSILDNLATQSAPVIREVGAKAAEIAAIAAERAGPLAQRAADATAQASVRVAERSRTLAAEWRRQAEGTDAGTPPSTPPAAAHGSDEDTTAPSGPTI
jgi:hypothetical protein